MKALSIQQPWAWAILHAGKDIENRTWPTPHRGRFLIHAGKRYDHEGHAWLLNQGFAVPANLPRGGIVGEAEIIDCVTASSSRWFFGPYGFALRNARELPFFPVPGQLGFFEVHYEPTLRLI